MLLLVLVALAVPAVSLAGGSAGDQQYTDPFSGGSSSHTAATTTSSAPATTTSSPAPATSSPAAAAPTPSADPSTVAAATTTAADPTATIATSSPTLPYTGYDAWTAVGFGLALLAGGTVIRWRVRRS
jgi:LPXTG-motif cell wall-anchored protein